MSPQIIVLVCYLTAKCFRALNIAGSFATPGHLCTELDWLTDLSPVRVGGSASRCCSCPWKLHRSKAKHQEKCAVSSQKVRKPGHANLGAGILSRQGLRPGEWSPYGRGQAEVVLSSLAHLYTSSFFGAGRLGIDVTKALSVCLSSRNT